MVVKSKAVKLSGLNEEDLTQSRVILSAALQAMAIAEKNKQRTTDPLVHPYSLRVR